MKKNEAVQKTDKAKDRRKAKQPAAKPTLAKITQYVVVSFAGLAGFVAYTSGASMEGALTRVVVVVLLCTVIGYALNIFLWLSTSESRPATSPGKGTSKGSAKTVGTKLDLVTDDDKANTGGEDRAPKAASATKPGPEKASA
ncbi:MAG: hypothetical protein IT330_04615 [Anaerolineae bacterium]|nr:hypothetical protein [Anaerolineae bacterium]